MRRAVLVAITLVACARREEARPAPETRPSAAAVDVDYPLEALTCRDGVLGVAVPTAGSAPAGGAKSAGISSLFADTDAGAAGDVGSGGLGLSGIGGFGSGAGKGSALYRLPTPKVFPMVGAPASARGSRAFAVAKTACGATAALKQCHDHALNPVGSLELELTVAGSKATAAKKTGGDLDDEALTSCVSAALVALEYPPGANGKTAYKITFEPAKNEPAPSGLVPTTTGSLSAAAIRSVVRAHMPKVRRCYQAALVTDPTLAGDLKVRFTIDPTGTPDAVRITDGTITDKALRSCVVGVFSAMSFPPPTGGSVTVSYPVVLSAS